MSCGSLVVLVSSYVSRLGCVWVNDVFTQLLLHFKPATCQGLLEVNEEKHSLWVESCQAQYTDKYEPECCYVQDTCSDLMSLDCQAGCGTTVLVLHCEMFGTKRSSDSLTWVVLT